ncbi:MAG: TIGR02281 family clan AA aspartic protease [Burkholderiales bacterium]
MKGHLAAAVVWIGLVAAGTLAFRHYGDRRPDVVASCEGGEVVVPAHRDGHFYLEGEINGAAVRFLVDTGATYVAVGPAMAGHAGVTGGSPAVFETAAGQVMGRVVPKQRAKVACFELPEVTVAVNPGLGETALLGQNALRRFEVVQTRQALRLRWRAGTR